MEISQLLNPTDESYSGTHSRATSRSEYHALPRWGFRTESSRPYVNHSPHQSSSSQFSHKMISSSPSRGRSSISHRSSNGFETPYSPSTPFSTDLASFDAEDLAIEDLSLNTAPSSVSGADTEVSLASESTMQYTPGSNKCEFDPDCQLKSEDRKVVSHFFGRNKSCTRRIPDDLFAPYCRKHYQRSRYRKVSPFGLVQMELVELTLARMKASGGITSFEVALKLSARKEWEAWELYERECEDAQRRGLPLPPRPGPDDLDPAEERDIVEKYLGKNRSFAQVGNLIGEVKEYVKTSEHKPPQFELLPSFKDDFGKQGTAPKKKSKSKLKPITTTTTTRSSGVKKHLRTPPASPAISRPTRSSHKSSLDSDESCKLEDPAPKRRLVQGKYINRR